MATLLEAIKRSAANDEVSALMAEKEKLENELHLATIRVRSQRSSGECVERRKRRRSCRSSAGGRRKEEECRMSRVRSRWRSRIKITTRTSPSRQPGCRGTDMSTLMLPATLTSR